MPLKGKKIVLAVSASIAAYKTPHLVRLLVKAGADVKVLITPAATDFVSPLSLATVSKHEVLSQVSDHNAWNNHVELGRWADLMLIAPCSANTLAKLANGLCDNLLCAVYLSAVCPVFIAPAMDEDMWKHPATKRNLDKMRAFGNHILPVEHGELASGLIGEGRMAEPETIVQLLSDFLDKSQKLKNTKALVTAGPTYEKLDPVRFIGNYSSGKMGIAIAEDLARRGAAVTLVLGPTVLRPQHTAIKVVPVESAAEMYDACHTVFGKSDIVVMAAAVADYKPLEKAAQKIKKNEATLSLVLEKTKDILASLGAAKKPKQIVVGFALETQNELENARTKLEKKNADLIILNSLNDAGAGFGYDTNKITIVSAGKEPVTLALQSKNAVAADIVNRIIALRNEK